MKQSWLNAHNANIAYENPVFRKALEDFLILPDGIGVDIASKVFMANAFRPISMAPISFPVFSST